VELVAGRIGRAHGLRGEVVVDVRTDRPDVRFAVGAELSTAPARHGPLTIATVRHDRGRLLVRFEGVSDRTAAEHLRGTDLVVRVDPEAEPPDDRGVGAEPEPAGADEYYDHELTGLAAYDPAGAPLGTVLRVEHPPAHDLLVLARPGGGEAQIPFVSAIVTDVDIAARRVTIDPPGGLLDLGAPETT
jgi:16S rRNA processing protein RimM